MRTQTEHQVEGFFHGGDHLVRMAEKHVKNNPNARASAILAMQRQEMTTLALLAARPSAERRSQEGVAVRQQNSPETPRPRRDTFLAACTLIGEALAAFSIFALIFIVPWVYLALTGEMLDFGAGK